MAEAPPDARMSRAEIDQTCTRLVGCLMARRLAIYPPGDKRRLPDDIPTIKHFQDARKQVEVIRGGMLALYDDVRPRKKPTNPLPLAERMREFLGLPAAFQGYYKRELLIKAINLHVTLNGLTVAGGVRVDEALSRACGGRYADGEIIQRRSVFSLTSGAFVTRAEGEEAAKVPSRVKTLLLRERAELQAVGDALTLLRKARQQHQLATSSPHAALLDREIRVLAASAAAGEAALLERAGETRLFGQVEHAGDEEVPVEDEEEEAIQEGVQEEEETIQDVQE
jgi:hypothetical protein